MDFMVSRLMCDRISCNDFLNKPIKDAVKCLFLGIYYPNIIESIWSVQVFDIVYPSGASLSNKSNRDR